MRCRLLFRSTWTRSTQKIGTDYKLFNYYGAADAEHVIIAMGSVNDTIEETIDYLLAAGREGRRCKGSSVQTVLRRRTRSTRFRIPLSRSPFLTEPKEPGALGEPLYLDVVAALKGTKFDDVPIFTGRYGLGSKDTTPAQIVAVYDNTEKTEVHHRYRR